MIKRTFLIVLLASLLLGFGQTMTYAFTFSTFVKPSSLNHSKYYTWGINWTLPAGYSITNATLTYRNIYDWTHEADRLFTNLLDTTTAGWVSYNDNQNGLVNKFNGTGYLLGAWDDPYGDSNHKATFSYNIPSNYYSWLSDGNFGFGIDPDCHYNLSKIKLRVDYCRTATPEPASMTLLGLGLLGIWGFGKRKNK